MSIEKNMRQYNYNKMKRREIREHVFKMLFLEKFHDKTQLPEQIELYTSTIEGAREDEIVYLEERYGNVMERLPEIDAMIKEASSGWDIDRMGKTDLTIIRLAVYELKYDEEIPTGVAINEAVELAKIFGQDNSPGFVNGILAKLV